MKAIKELVSKIDDFGKKIEREGYEGDNVQDAIKTMNENRLLWQSQKVEKDCIKTAYVIHDNLFLNQDAADSIRREGHCERILCVA